MSDTTPEHSFLINPQLAKTLNPKRFKITKPWWLEPKLDGLRGVIVDNKGKAVGFSRNGKPFWNIDHILEQLTRKQFANHFLDGEFFSENWNKSMSILKRQREPHPDAANIRFNIFDMVPLVHGQLCGTDAPLRDRYAKLENALSSANPNGVILVEHQIVTSYAQIQEEYVHLLEKGYEGGMVKDPDGPYELGRRSPYWLKIKPWTDADLFVTEAYEGNGKHVGRLGKVLLEGDVEWNDKSYHVISECGTGFDDTQRETFWKMYKEGKLIDQIFEVKFQEITEDKSMRFPVFNRLRLDK